MTCRQGSKQNLLLAIYMLRSINRLIDQEGRRNFSATTQNAGSLFDIYCLSVNFPQVDSLHPKMIGGLEQYYQKCW